MEQWTGIDPKIAAKLAEQRAQIYGLLDELKQHKEVTTDWATRLYALGPLNPNCWAAIADDAQRVTLDFAPKKNSPTGWAMKLRFNAKRNLVEIPVNYQVYNALFDVAIADTRKGLPDRKVPADWQDLENYWKEVESQSPACQCTKKIGDLHEAARVAIARGQRAEARKMLRAVNRILEAWQQRHLG
jgi:hypothetical protein